MHHLDIGESLRDIFLLLFCCCWGDPFEMKKRDDEEEEEDVIKMMRKRVSASLTVGVRLSRKKSCK